MMAAGTIPFLLGIPETSAPHILINKAKRLRRTKAPGYENVRAPFESEDRTLAGLFRVAFVRPPAIFIDPIAFVIALYTALVYTLLYMLFAIYPIVFRDKRGYNAGVSELPLIGTVVGACIAGCYVFYSSRQDRKNLIAGKPRVPEDRLAMVSAPHFCSQSPSLHNEHVGQDRRHPVSHYDVLVFVDCSIQQHSVDCSYTSGNLPVYVVHPSLRSTTQLSGGLLHKVTIAASLIMEHS